MLLLQCPDVCSNIVTFYWRFIISIQSTDHFTLEQCQVYYQSQSMHLEHQHINSQDSGHISSTATGQPSILPSVNRLPYSLLKHIPTTPQMLAPLIPLIKASRPLFHPCSTASQSGHSHTVPAHCFRARVAEALREPSASKRSPINATNSCQSTLPSPSRSPSLRSSFSTWAYRPPGANISM